MERVSKNMPNAKKLLSSFKKGKQRVYLFLKSSDSGNI